MPVLSISSTRPPFSYAVHIEAGVLTRAGDETRRVAPHPRCLLAVDANIADSHGAMARQSLEQAGYEVTTAPLHADEKLKTLGTVEDLYRSMLAARLDRGSPVVALGGGLVGDVAGFAAATFLRGVPLVHIPTTLLAMVDATIGGKTGVNHPLPGSRDLAKNMVGAFWQPSVVLSDPMTLRTLGARDFRCGLAECIKHALVADAALLRWIADHAASLHDLRMDELVTLVERSASIKAAIVTHDEREHGRRALLNLGHTFAHAIEATSNPTVPHGEAVAMGLVAASCIAHARGRLTAGERDEIDATLAACALPRRAPDGLSFARLLHAMAFDKKSQAGARRLVLPRGIGEAEIVHDVSDDEVREAWMHLGVEA